MLSGLRGMATLMQDRLLFLLNIPLRWRHRQFWTTGQLTCQNATPEVAKETGDQNTMRVEREILPGRYLHNMFACII